MSTPTSPRSRNATVSHASDDEAATLHYDIVRLGHDNASVLEVVAEDVFDEAVDPGQLAAFLGDPRHIMFVALRDGVVVGMASAVEYFHPDKPPQLWINEVGVASAHRRRGIARRLVEAQLAEGRSRGCVFAWLGTDLDNLAGNACFGSVNGVEDAQPFNLYEWALTKAGDASTQSGSPPPTGAGPRDDGEQGL